VRDGGFLILESGAPYESLRAVLLRDHDVRTRTPTKTFGDYQANRWDRENRVFFGAVERRKDGQAVGN
jgi:gamma-glutamyltranspeptidase/glutathione hydrolase